MAERVDGIPDRLSRASPEELPGGLMFFLQHSGQLPIEELHSPFGRETDPKNRWVLFEKLNPSMSLETRHGPHSSAPSQGLLSGPSGWRLERLASKPCLQVSDRETVELITGSPWLQLCIGLSRHQDLPPLDPSMMVPFRKRIDDPDSSYSGRSHFRGVLQEKRRPEVHSA